MTDIVSRLRQELPHHADSFAAMNDQRFEAADHIERLEGTLQQIDDWCEAYPVSVFPEPDIKKAAGLLKAGGMTLDAVSASAMRHVLSTMPTMIRNTLKGGKDGE